MIRATAGPALTSSTIGGNLQQARLPLIGHLETICLPSGTTALPQQAAIPAAQLMVSSVPLAEVVLGDRAGFLAGDRRKGC
jgi:hypothetical protein